MSNAHRARPSNALQPTITKIAQTTEIDSLDRLIPEERKFHTECLARIPASNASAYHGIKVRYPRAVFRRLRTFERLLKDMKDIRFLGDRGFLIEFDSEREANSWARSLREEDWPGMIDIVPAYLSVAVFCNPDVIDLDRVPGRLRSLTRTASEAIRSREILIPVLYDGEDLEASADELGLTVNELVATHTSISFQVFAIGFLPGFPYAGYLPDRITGLPRLEKPRVKVPAGSVAIVGRQTAVYPGVSPGGWRLLGRTPLCLVDPTENYFPIQAGDSLRFHPIDQAEFEHRRGERP